VGLGHLRSRKILNIVVSYIWQPHYTVIVFWEYNFRSLSSLLRFYTFIFVFIVFVFVFMRTMMMSEKKALFNPVPNGSPIPLILSFAFCIYFRNYLFICCFNLIGWFNGWIDSVNGRIQSDWNVLWSSRVKLKLNRWCCSPWDCIGLAH